MRNHAFSEIEARNFAKFAKYANCGQKPIAKTCKECLHPEGGYKMFFYYQLTRMGKYHYKFFIHYNDAKKQVVLSFGAPSVDNHQYVRAIYSRGWSLVKIYQIKIEKEFRTVYFKKVRSMLHKKVNKIKKSGRGAYKFIFTGYSIGGSLAILASFDLTKSGILNKAVNHPSVFTYGSLRIGDANFVALINSTVTLWRIVKQNDYIVRTPNCYYSVALRSWRCVTAPVIKKYLVAQKPFFPVTYYYKSYVPSRGPLGKLLIFRKNQNKGPIGRLRAAHHATPAARRQFVVPTTYRSSIVRNYYRNVYYTQPLGYEIFYNSAMTSYKPCLYIRGIPTCERRYVLPTTFTTQTHKTYYGINFEQC